VKDGVSIFRTEDGDIMFPSKCQYLPTSPHCFTAYKRKIYIFTAVKGATNLDVGV
jgi:hypothetical protein